MKRLLVKVCGMTRPEDARLCASLGADLLGFIFHPGSPRNADPALPASLGPLELPGVRKVGVFVAQGVDQTCALMDAGRLDLAQLHGGQDLAFCEELGRVIGPQRIVKVLWPEKAAGLEDFQAELDRFAPVCGMFLLDAGSGGGGHGRAIQPGAAADMLLCADFPRPWLLAGGLAPATVGPALERFAPLGARGPAGVDLNSGVESSPGIKDEQLLRAAFLAIHAARAAKNNEVTP